LSRCACYTMRGWCPVSIWVRARIERIMETPIEQQHIWRERSPIGSANEVINAAKSVKRFLSTAIAPPRRMLYENIGLHQLGYYRGVPDADAVPDDQDILAVGVERKWWPCLADLVTGHIGLGTNYVRVRRFDGCTIWLFTFVSGDTRRVDRVTAPVVDTTVSFRTAGVTATAHAIWKWTAAPGTIRWHPGHFRTGLC